MPIEEYDGCGGGEMGNYQLLAKLAVAGQTTHTRLRLFWPVHLLWSLSA